MTGCISSHLSQYDTMGDGEVQHSPDCLVQAEDLVDVVASLAASLDRVPVSVDGEESGTEPIRWFWRAHSEASDKLIAFLLTLKYVDNKDTYFTFEDGGKKSHSESKRHDKRWHKIERPYSDDKDSAVDRVLRFLHMGDHHKPFGVIQWVATVQAIARVDDPDMARSDAAKFLQACDCFKGLTRYEICCFLDHYDRITDFKQAVHTMRRARHNAQEQRRQHERTQELQTA
jgi:hypothetical protein